MRVGHLALQLHVAHRLRRRAAQELGEIHGARMDQLLFSMLFEALEGLSGSSMAVFWSFERPESIDFAVASRSAPAFGGPCPRGQVGNGRATSRRMRSRWYLRL